MGLGLVEAPLELGPQYWSTYLVIMLNKNNESNQLVLNQRMISWTHIRGPARDPDISRRSRTNHKYGVQSLVHKVQYTKSSVQSLMYKV